MGRELDRSKGAGKTHDAERDPGHYVDLADDGSVEGIVPLDKLPATREEYDSAPPGPRQDAVPGRLPSLFDRRRLPAAPEGLCLLAGAH